MKPISAIVAGTGFYSPQTIRRCSPGTVLELRREPRNRYDANAIAVYRKGWLFSTQLGHLKASLAKRLAPRMDAGERFTAVVVSTWAPEDIEHPRLSIRIDPVE